MTQLIMIGKRTLQRAKMEKARISWTDLCMTGTFGQPKIVKVKVKINKT